MWRVPIDIIDLQHTWPPYAMHRSMAALRTASQQWLEIGMAIVVPVDFTKFPGDSSIVEFSP